MQLKLVAQGEHDIRLQARGRITQASFPPDKDPLSDMLGIDVYHQRVLLDLEGLDYMDSTGVGWLLSCHKRFREAGGMLVIYSVPKVVDNIFKLMRLERVLHLAADAQEAEKLAAETTE